MDIYEVNKQIWVNSPEMRKSIDYLFKGEKIGWKFGHLKLRARMWWCKKRGHKWSSGKVYKTGVPDINGSPDACNRCGLMVGCGGRMRLWNA